MASQAICIRRNAVPDAHGLYNPHNSFPPFFLPPAWDCDADCETIIPQPPPTPVRPGIRFEHGQITPPLETDGSLNPWAPLPSCNSAVDQPPHPSTKEQMIRQWITDMPSAAQRMIAADLRLNRCQGRCKQTTNYRVGKDTESNGLRRRSSNRDDKSQTAQAEVGTQLAGLVNELHL
ncbi:hypothetical protein BDV25DRAFT_147554 [Aspergillus avenaceus]|uniref:Uncharacterized protein n=1 Tax=Aspergillus avenaceus TaxID=36643 RepID=A0A5N6U7R3_ASPAV|nr:hypothetical protein BDV25DRAFT_147554 [Aspergillus avenaceus]